VPNPSEAAGLRREERLDACALSFIAAFVDTWGFIALYGLFTAHVTGNFVLIGAQLVSQGGELITKLLALPVFVIAVMAAVILAGQLRRGGRSPKAVLLWMEAGLLVGAMVTLIVLQPAAHPDDPPVVVAGMLTAGSMGLQNALMRIEFASLPSTTVMTVNVTQAAIDVALILGWDASASKETSKRDQARVRFARMAPPILAFTAGASAGAGGYASLGVWALLVPATLCSVFAFRFVGRD